MKNHPLFLRIITDIHVGEDRGDRVASKAIGLLEEFVKTTNKDRPEAVVDMGDRVMQTSPEEDQKNLKKISTVFNKLSVPHHHVHGNHDLLHLRLRSNQRYLGLNSSRSYSADVGTYHLIFWNPSLEITKEGVSASREHIDWLETTLMETDRPVLLFTHVPLDDAALLHPKNKHEQRLPYFAHYPQNPFIRKILEESGKVVACFAGHRHLNRHYEINGISYLTLDSFVKRTAADETVPSGAYADLRIDEEGNVSYEVKGKEPVSFSFKKNPSI